MDADGSNIKQLTHDSAEDAAPSAYFSPPGLIITVDG
jgi:hypothetical protein